MKLDLKDWKELEINAKEALRQAMTVVIIHELTLKKAREEIEKANKDTGTNKTSV